MSKKKRKPSPPLKTKQTKNEPVPPAGSPPPQTDQTDHTPPQKRTYKFPGIEAVEEALCKRYGNLSQTARALRVSRNTLKNWIDESPQLQAARQAARSGFLEIAESKLIDLVSGEIAGFKEIEGELIPIYTRLPSLQAIELVYKICGQHPEQTPAREPEQEDAEEDDPLQLPDNGTQDANEAPLPESWQTITSGVEPG